MVITSSIDAAEKAGIAAGITIEMAVQRLKVDESFFVLSQGNDIGLHRGFVIWVIQVERAAVEPYEPYLGGQPQIAILIEKKVVDAVLRKSVLVGEMPDGIAVNGFGLG